MRVISALLLVLSAVVSKAFVTKEVVQQPSLNKALSLRGGGEFRLQDPNTVVSVFAVSVQRCRAHRIHATSSQNVSCALRAALQ